MVKISRLGKLFATKCRRRKRVVTSNSSRVGLISVSPQGVREESAAYFERRNPSGDSVLSWASENEKRKSKLQSNEATLQRKAHGIRVCEDITVKSGVDEIWQQKIDSGDYTREM
ncbi:hypothetical protein TNCV_2918331 [Trichonephila clavipes]|nr:hypothetical protein TNCV_2918331 [Trichonephila clavipes]